jgi:hypothetical protein
MSRSCNKQFIWCHDAAIRDKRQGGVLWDKIAIAF